MTVYCNLHCLINCSFVLVRTPHAAESIFFFFNTHQRKSCYVSIRVCSEVIVVFFFFTPPDRSIFTVLLRLQLSKLFSFTVLFFFFYPLSSLHHHNNTTKKKGKEKKNSIFMCCQFKLALYTTQLTVSLCFLSLNRTSFSHIFFFLSFLSLHYSPFHLLRASLHAGKKA